jgi:putative endonuclease
LFLINIDDELCRLCPDSIGALGTKNPTKDDFFGLIMFYVYILYSYKIDKYYIGYSENPEKRLIEKHNLGYVKSTKNGVPYILKSKKQFLTEIEAIQEERRLKKAKNRIYLKYLIDNNW